MFVYAFAMAHIAVMCMGQGMRMRMGQGMGLPWAVAGFGALQQRPRQYIAQQACQAAHLAAHAVCQPVSTALHGVRTTMPWLCAA